MPVDFDISSNVNKVIAQLTDIQKEQIPFATSRAEEFTIKAAVDAAEKQAQKDLDRLTPGVSAKGHTKGMIRGKWRSKNQVKAAKNSAVKPARVFIVNKEENTSDSKKKFDLTDEIHPLVFGGRVNSVPDKSKAVITPTTALMKGLRGSGRLKELNQYGNLAGFRKKKLTRLRERTDLYLNVPIGNTNPKTSHLPPGLYFKGREIVDISGDRNRVDKKLTRSRAKLDKRKRDRGKRVRWYLVMLLAYHERRDYDQQFDFRDAVLKIYVSKYQSNFKKALANAIATAKPRKR